MRLLLVAATTWCVLAAGVARAEIIGGYEINKSIIGTYVDASLDNTDNAAGGADSTWATTADEEVDNLWRIPATSGHPSWLIFGGGSAIEAVGLRENAPTLATTIGGLTAGQDYAIRLIFGSHTDAQHKIMGGLSASSLTTYDQFNATVAGVTSYSYENGSMNLWQALLGTARADSNGTITAYIDTATSGGNNARAVYDGLSYAAVPEPGSVSLLVAGLVGLLAYTWRRS